MKKDQSIKKIIDFKELVENNDDTQVHGRSVPQPSKVLKEKLFENKRSSLPKLRHSSVGVYGSDGHSRNRSQNESINSLGGGGTRETISTINPYGGVGQTS